MIYGHNLFEVRWIIGPFATHLWLVFEPAHYVQASEECIAQYEVEVFLRDSSRVYAYSRKTLRLKSTLQELPTTPNFAHFKWENIPSHSIQWEISVWDLERYVNTLQKGFLPPPKESWSVSLFYWGKGVNSSSLNPSHLCLYSVPKGTYLGQVALYHAESSLPELTRYLSIEERRFTINASGELDTLQLYWRVRDLLPGRYLIGFYLYKREELVYGAFYPVLRK
ncbi:MAG: hypothetical protein RMJ66_04990 [Bacteroidia bacterium]|nr:hypothetical protein [Bacteroidia bacterium]MDW8134402.1 hypothetical protein [Bacteroidia bacterium]